MSSPYDVWEAAVARPEPLMLPGLLAFIFLSVLMAYVYPRGYAGGDSLREGARFGLMASGFVVWSLLVVYAAYNVELGGTIADIVFNVAILTVMGAAIGMIYRRGTDTVDTGRPA